MESLPSGGTDKSHKAFLAQALDAGHHGE